MFKKTRGVTMEAYGEIVRRYAELYVSRHYGYFYPDIVFDHGLGPYVYDTAGKRYIDAGSNESFLNFGHQHPAIMEAKINQIRVLEAICGCNFLNPPQAHLARALAVSMPKKFSWKVFFTNSGAESIEGAIKLAQYASNRLACMAFFGCFHGRTLGALALTHSNPVQRKGFYMPLPVGHVRWDDIESLWERGPVRPQDVAAFFVEPIQGYGGVRVPSPGFLRTVREFCDKFGILMVVDEIQTGLGRTGSLWAFEQEGIIPDIVCSAKSLGGGEPLGAVIAKKEIMDRWEPGSHGSSGGGHPVACAGGFRLFSLLDEPLFKRVHANGNILVDRLRICLAPYQVSGRGLMIGVELCDSMMRNAIMAEAARRGLIMLRANANSYDRSIRLLPPLNTPVEILYEIADILEKSLAAVAEQRPAIDK